MPRADSLLRWLRRLSGKFLAPERAHSRTQWLEVLLFPLVAIALGWLGSPDDPLLINAAFPWIWFAPTLIALRYGVLSGLLSILPLFFDWLAADVLNKTMNYFPRDFFFGGSLLVLICGEFSDIWRDRIVRVEETNLYVTERLSRLTKRHLLLNLSHDRLEQEMLARPGSLRDALVKLRDDSIKKADDDGGLPAAGDLLHLLALYCNIESASLYAVSRQDKQYRLEKPASTLGEPQPLEQDDELLALALDKLSLAHIAETELSMEKGSNQLVVAPLVASDDSIAGVLSITKMPFFSLNLENLQMVSVILAYYANYIRVAPSLLALRQRLPAIPLMYAEELTRMMRMQQVTGISSHIVVMTFTGPHKEDIPSQFLRIKRGLDLYWQTRIGGDPVIAVLMPFASSSAKEGFLLRIEGWLKSRFGGNFDSLRVNIHAIDFANENPVDALARITVA